MATVVGNSIASSAAEPVDRTSIAIYWWVAIGVFFIAMQLYVFGSAIYAGDFFNPADPGPTPIPEWMRINFLIQDTAWGVAILYTFYVWVLSPLVKTRQFSIEGLMWLGIASVIWQDPLEGYLHQVFTYNTHAFNIGGWACHIPGWVSPGGCGIAEPITWLPAFYVVCIVTCLVWGLRIAFNIKAKKPHTSTVKIFFWLAIAIAFLDLAFELSEIALGYYHYGGLSMGIFPDSRMRFPIWEPVLVAILYLTFASAVYNKNDKGETIAERGLSRVPGGSAKKQALRLVAFVGIMNCAYIAGYNGPVIMISIIKHHEWPKDVQDKSYFTNGLCGEGTTYSCGGDNVASPRKGASIHIGPNGELVVPPGAKVPQLVPLKRTADL